MLYANEDAVMSEGSDLLVAALENEGVDRIIGIPEGCSAARIRPQRRPAGVGEVARSEEKARAEP